MSEVFGTKEQKKPEATPLPPANAPIPAPIKIEPTHAVGILEVEILGHKVKWYKNTDAYGASMFRSHPLWGRDVRLPYYVMKFWDDFIDAKELPGKRDNAFIVWALKNFTWLGSKYWIDETAWCKAIWNAACETAGFKVGDSALASEGMKEGVAVPAGDERHGDFCILSHIDANGNFNGRRHITFWERYGESHVYGRGGNQGNDVNVSQWSKKEVSKPGSVRRLTLKQSMIPEVAKAA